MTNKFIKFGISSIVCALPIFAFAAAILPNCGYGDVAAGTFRECGFGDLMQLFSNIINYLVLVSFPLATITIAWAGFVMMTARDNAGQRTNAKKMMYKVIIGFMAILAAWIIVRTVLTVFVKPEIIDKVPLNLN